MEPQFFREFITLAVVHFLAVIAPGADFAMVVKQSLTYGRKVGVWTSIGIGLGMVLHFIYTILGLGLVISKSILLFNIIKYLGAIYLVYIGLKSLKAKRGELSLTGETDVRPGLAAGKAVWSGFLVNALNPKATLFFLSIFSVIVSPETPAVYQIGYCLWIFMVQILWFSSLALLLSHRVILVNIKRFGHWVERSMGAVLIALGVKLALTSNK